MSIKDSLDLGTLTDCQRTIWEQLRQKLALDGAQLFTSDELHDYGLAKKLGYDVIIVKGRKYTSGGMIGNFLRNLDILGLTFDTGVKIPSARASNKRNKVTVYGVVE
jgi:hypothetical protein